MAVGGILVTGAFFLGGIAWLALATQPAWIGGMLALGGAGWMFARLRD